MREASSPANVVPEAAAAKPADAPIAVADEVSRRSRLRYWLVAAAVAAFLAAGISLGARGLRDRALNRAAVRKISSLAVLPLDNLSGDPGQNYFADGMTDELTTMLAKNSTLRVVSRTSVMQYKGARRPLPEIARELGVDGILEGSVERTGDKERQSRNQGGDRRAPLGQRCLRRYGARDQYGGSQDPRGAER